MGHSEQGLHKELEARLRFETTLTEISTGFINMPADQVSRGIREVQRRVCEALGLDRSTLWQIAEDASNSFVLTHWHQAPDGPPIPERINAMDYFPWAARKTLEGKTIVLSKLSDLPREAARDRDSFERFGAKSTLLIPLSSGGGPVFGVVSFAAMREGLDWTEMQVKQLQLVAQVFANALGREKAHQQLMAAFAEIERLKEQLEAENIYLREDISGERSVDDLIGKSDGLG